MKINNLLPFYNQELNILERLQLFVKNLELFSVQKLFLTFA